MEELPEEVQLAILDSMDDELLLECAKISRNLNRLAVQLGFERHRVQDPTRVFEVEFNRDISVDAISFLEVSLDCHTFVYFCLDFYSLTHFYDTPFIYQKLRIVTRFLQKIDKIEATRLDCAFSKIDWDIDPPGAEDGPLFSEVLERFLNVVSSKGCREFRLWDCSEITRQEWEYTLCAGMDDLSHNDILMDEHRYEEVFPPPPGHVQYQAMSDLIYPLKSIGCALQILKPPFSQWSFNYLQRHAPPKVLLDIDVDVPEQEFQFILSRLAHADPTILNMYICFDSPLLLPRFLQNIGLFSKTLVKLDIRANATDQGCDEDVAFDLPVLERLAGTPTFLIAILSPRNRVSLPKLRTVAVCVQDGRTFCSGFNAHGLAASLATIQSHLGAIYHQVGSSHISLVADVQFWILSEARGLTEDLRRGVRPRWASAEHAAAMNSIEGLTIRLVTTTRAILQGEGKEEIQALVTAFSGLKTLKIRGGKSRGMEPVALEGALFDSLVFRCPSLTTVTVN